MKGDLDDGNLDDEETNCYIVCNNDLLSDEYFCVCYWDWDAK